MIGVLILGGGEATRLRDKLALAAGAQPLIARVYRNVSPGRETFVSCKATFPPELDVLLPCPMVVDRWTRRGPLAGMLSTMQQMRSPYVFAVAGDAPFIDSAFIEQLAGRMQPGDEAVVPRHDGRLEPLAAIYERAAFVDAGLPLFVAGSGGLRPVIERLRTRYVEFDDDRVFANVNTPADYSALHGMLT